MILNHFSNSYDLLVLFLAGFVCRTIMEHWFDLEFPCGCLFFILVVEEGVVNSVKSQAFVFVNIFHYFDNMMVLQGESWKAYLLLSQGSWEKWDLVVDLLVVFEEVTMEFGSSSNLSWAEFGCNYNFSVPF